VFVPVQSRYFVLEWLRKWRQAILVILGITCILLKKLAGTTGLEPATSCVTGIARYYSVSLLQSVKCILFQPLTSHYNLPVTPHCIRFDQVFAAFSGYRSGYSDADGLEDCA
jgi:hypothetical protein